MQLIFRQQGQSRALLAEGAVDAGLVARLNTAFKKYKPINEIWLGSPGGDAKAGNEARLLIRTGVCRKLLTEVMYRQKAVADRGTDPSTRRCLSKGEMRKCNVANAD